MTLWNLIRDFFVLNIFGGYSSDGQEIKNNLIGLASLGNNRQQGVNNGNVYVPIGDIGYTSGDLPMKLAIGDWLSTTFTIITLILLVIFLIIFVKWIFKVFAGLFRY